jgi:hypothetical protein
MVICGSFTGCSLLSPPVGMFLPVHKLQPLLPDLIGSGHILMAVAPLHCEASRIMYAIDMPGPQ